MLNIGALIWAGIILALLIALGIVATWHYGKFKKRGMAHPKQSLILSNMWSFATGKKSQGDLDIDTYNLFKGHRAISCYMCGSTVIGIVDPEVIRMVTVKDFDSFADHMPIVEKKDDKLFGKNLIYLKGDQWKAMRNTLSPAFTSSKMKAMYSLVDKCGEQLANYLQDKCKDGVIQLEMRDLFTRYANDVIATAAYGIHCDSLKEPDNEFYKMGLEITNFGGLKIFRILAYILFPKICRFLRVRLIPSTLENFFCSIITDTMATREREKIIRPDMIHLLMEARKGTLKGDEDDDDPNKKAMDLSDDDISAQAFIFFLAGFDTSSTLLSFLSYQLAVSPEVQEKVQREIDEALATNEGVLSYDAVQKMKYLDTVISETLRLWPPVFELDRMCLKDYTVPATASAPAIIIKKGERVQLPVLPLHRDPEYWPEPDRFDPDRFSEENKHKIKPFTFIPFGSGPRGCIGSRFALMEAKIAIANVLSKVTLVVAEKTPAPLRFQKKTFNVRAEGGIWLGVKLRET